MGKIEATVVCSELDRDGSDVVLLELSMGVNFKADPGQFVVLEPLDGRSVMPRPFSIVEVCGNNIQLLIKPIGLNTQFYANLKKEETIQVIGPQGSPILIDPDSEKYILVGGGIGGAALTFFAGKLYEEKKRPLVLLGGKTESEIVAEWFFSDCGFEVRTITDDCGFVTDLLEKELSVDEEQATVVACGPKAMLEAVYLICEKHGNKCLSISSLVG